MPFGNLNARVVLDHPRETYYGSEKEISGNVALTFSPKDANITELYGPIEISVFLEGRSKTKIYVRRGRYTSTHRGRAPVLAAKSVIYTGPIRIPKATPHSVPFKLRFPEHIHNLPTDEFDPDPHFDMTPNSPLPPTMVYHYDSGFMNHRFECFVEYRLRTELSMPGLDVTVTNMDQKEGCPIRYEQPRVPGAIIYDALIQTPAHKLSISNKFLLPEHERPSGFKAKTAAFFKSDAYPTFAIDAMLEGPANLLLGEELKFKLSVRPDIQRSTVRQIPDVKFAMFRMSINSWTLVRAEIAFLSRVQSEDKERQMTLTGLLEDALPFSKANDYTKIVYLKAIQGIPSAFSTKNITRAYTVDFEVSVIVAEETKNFKFKDIPVRILPPPIERSQLNSSSAPAGPSTVEEELPAYPASGAAGQGSTSRLEPAFAAPAVEH